MRRRNFLKKIGLGTAGLTTAGLLKMPKANAAEKNKWKLEAAFPLQMGGLGPGVTRFCKNVTELSRGELEITPYGAGDLVPPMEVFDAVRQGVLQMGASAAYYWIGKIPEAGFFASWPFGLDFDGMMAWMYNGGGLELWQEIYGEFGIIPFPLESDGMMMGGWFRKEINSVDDLKGLKFRIPGLGGQVYAKAGVNVVNFPVGELYTALERGIVDAVKMANPLLDLPQGYHQVAKYYYYPGWHEPGINVELLINKKAYEGGRDRLKQVIKIASKETLLTTFLEFEAANANLIQELTESKKIELRKFPDDVLQLVKKLSKEVMEEQAANDPKYKRVYEAATTFQNKYRKWEKITKFTRVDW